jgi:hypothetical protein
MVPTSLEISKEKGYVSYVHPGPKCAEVKQINLGIELIPVSARAFDGFEDAARVKSNKKLEKSDWNAFGLFEKYRMRRFQRYLQKGKRRSGRRSKHMSRQQMCQNGKQAVRKKHMVIWGGSGRWGRKASDGM